jgi:hypothetical protein
MFVHLRPPSVLSTRATWDEEALQLDTVHCRLNPGHQRAGPRRSDPRVKVPGIAGDITWAC